METEIQYVETQEQETPVQETLEQRVAKLQAELAEIKAAKSSVPKNHQPGKPDASRKYQLLSKELKSWGKVPQQQADIAKILSDNFEVGEEIPETELFEVISREAVNFPSLAKSKQDPTYLFKYYRGLKASGNHAGFIARDFLLHT